VSFSGVRYVLGPHSHYSGGLPTTRHAGFTLRRDAESLFLHTLAVLSCAQWDCSASSCSS
jgi:hypothetical protein